MAAVTSSHPPHSSSAARVRSVRGARREYHRPTTSASRAAGSSQDACAPIRLSNSRSGPVAPLKPVPPPPPEPPPRPPPPAGTPPPPLSPPPPGPVEPKIRPRPL